NYSRPGFADHALRFGGLVEFNGTTLRSSLGGAGLAISRTTKHLDIALDYARMIASPECQAGLYFSNGGQPGHRAAWQDPGVNAECGNFFLNTLRTLDDAVLRPVYNGHVQFQALAGDVVHRFLAENGNPCTTVAELEELYRHECH